MRVMRGSSLGRVLACWGSAVLPVAEGDGERDHPKGGGGATRQLAPPPRFTRSPSPRASRAGRTGGSSAPLDDEVRRLLRGDMADDLVAQSGQIEAGEEAFAAAEQDRGDGEVHRID